MITRVTDGGPTADGRIGSPLSFDDRYLAIVARDTRFDGQFVTAVRTTKIYCRPSCPARTPLRHNVEFFTTGAAAHEAGYRACKRCLPQAAPGSSDWNVRADVVARAMRLITDGVVEREGVNGLANRLGYSPRHLGRLVSDELGAGPLALARTQRANTARALLVSTSLTVTDIAFASGFSSVRQFNDTFGQMFGLTPTQLRAARRDHQTASAIELTLPVRQPLDHEGIFEWLAERAIDSVELGDDRTYSRTVKLPGGPAWFQVRFDGRLRLTVHLSELSDLATLVARVRRLFDLDADPAAIDDALRDRSELAPYVEACPGIRLPGALDPHELLIRAMVGQQVSVRAARTQLCRLTEHLGQPVDLAGQRRRLFPTMEAIAEHGVEVLRGPRTRVRAIVAVAGALASGELSLTCADDPIEQSTALVARAGIGNWTAGYVRMRVLNDPDVFLVEDLALRTGARSIGLADRASELRSWAAPSAPWRSYVSRHLWRASHQRARLRSQCSRQCRRSTGTSSRSCTVTQTLEMVDTPDGPFSILSNSDGVFASGWTSDPEALIGRLPRGKSRTELKSGTTPATPATRAVELFYEGQFDAIHNVVVCMAGTPWQRMGWAALRQIEPGAPLTYAQFARELGSANAVRAAAAICARNPAALFVPCHRVLRSDGSLSGFAWGTSVKRSLLEREAQVRVPQPDV